MYISIICFDLNETLVDRRKRLRKYSKEVIEALKKCGVRVGVWSSAQKKNVNPILINTGLKDLLDFVITRDEIYQPDPEPVKRWDTIKSEKFLERLFSVPADQVLFVDDNERKLRFNKLSKSYIIPRAKSNDDELLQFWEKLISKTLD